MMRRQNERYVWSFEKNPFIPDLIGQADIRCQRLAIMAGRDNNARGGALNRLPDRTSFHCLFQKSILCYSSSSLPPPTIPSPHLVLSVTQSSTQQGQDKDAKPQRQIRKLSRGGETAFGTQRQTTADYGGYRLPRFNPCRQNRTT